MRNAPYRTLVHSVSLLLAGSAILGCPSPTEEIVPDIIGLTESEAEAVLANAGFVMGSVAETYSLEGPARHVISQNPPADSRRAAGTLVDLVVSLGPEATVESGVVTIPGATILVAGESAQDTMEVDPEALVGVFKEGRAYFYHPALGDAVLNEETSRRAMGRWMAGTMMAKRNAVLAQTPALPPKAVGDSWDTPLGLNCTHTSASSYTIRNMTWRWVALRSEVPGQDPVFLAPQEAIPAPELFNALRQHLGNPLLVDDGREVIVDEDGLATFGSVLRIVPFMPLTFVPGITEINAEVQEALAKDSDLYLRLHGLDFIILIAETVKAVTGIIPLECFDGAFVGSVMGAVELAGADLLIGDEQAINELGTTLTLGAFESLTLCGCTATGVGTLPCELLATALDIIAFYKWLLDDVVMGTIDAIRYDAFDIIPGPEANLATLMLNLTPDDGQWTVTGPGDFSQNGVGDTTLSGLETGDYTVTCLDTVAGFFPPGPVTVTLGVGEIRNLQLEYLGTDLEVSPMEVTLEEGARSATVTVSNIGQGELIWTAAPSSDDISVSPSDGRGGPTEVTISTGPITASFLATVLFSNLQNPSDFVLVQVNVTAPTIDTGTLDIDVTPDAGAWTIMGPDGYELSASGDKVIHDLEPGTYRFSCDDNVPGYLPPGDQSVQLQAGGWTEVYLTYNQEGVFSWVSSVVDRSTNLGIWADSAFEPSTGNMVIAAADLGDDDLNGSTGDLWLWYDADGDGNFGTEERTVVVSGLYNGTGVPASMALSVAFAPDGRLFIAYVEPALASRLNIWHDTNGDFSAEGDANLGETHTLHLNCYSVDVAIAPDGDCVAAFYGFNTGVDPELPSPGLMVWSDFDGDFSLEGDDGELSLIDPNDSTTDRVTSIDLGFDAQGRSTVAYHVEQGMTGQQGELRLWHDVDDDRTARDDSGEIRTIETGGNSGYGCSMAFAPNGRASVAFTDRTNGLLKLWRDANGNFMSLGESEITELDTTPEDSYAGTSLAFEADGTACVAYEGTGYQDGYLSFRGIKLWRDLDGDSSSEGDAGEIQEIGKYNSQGYGHSPLLGIDHVGHAALVFPCRHGWSKTTLALWRDDDGDFSHDDGETRFYLGKGFLDDAFNPVLRSAIAIDSTGLVALPFVSQYENFMHEPQYRLWLWRDLDGDDQSGGDPEEVVLIGDGNGDLGAAFDRYDRLTVAYAGSDGPWQQSLRIWHDANRNLTPDEPGEIQIVEGVSSSGPIAFDEQGRLAVFHGGGGAWGEGGVWFDANGDFNANGEDDAGESHQHFLGDFEELVYLRSVSRDRIAFHSDGGLLLLYGVEEYDVTFEEFTTTLCLWHDDDGDFDLDDTDRAELRVIHTQDGTWPYEYQGALALDASGRVMVVFTSLEDGAFMIWHDADNDLVAEPWEMQSLSDTWWSGSPRIDCTPNGKVVVHWGQSQLWYDANGDFVFDESEKSWTSSEGVMRIRETDGRIYTTATGSYGNQLLYYTE